MLRGSSRHDGIPIKQSAKDRDRDRQREQQRKERAQMLPDDKEIHPSAQDLFHAPVKVRPSVEDTTTVQIRNTLGNFDTVRHLMLETSSRRLSNLVGVDQGALVGGSPVAPHRVNSSTHGLEPPPYRPPNNSSQVTKSLSSSGAEQNNTKSHYRSIFPANQHTSGISNNSSSNSQNTSTSNSGNSLSTTSSSFRTSSSSNPIPPNPLQKVPHSQTQLSQHNNNSYTVISNPSSVPVPNCPNNSGAILNTKSPNLSTNNNQVRLKPNLNPGHVIANNTSAGLELSGGDSLSGSSSVDKNSSVFNNEPISNNSASVSNDKNNRNSSATKKPALERVDSHLELENILKEMMDVTTPLNPIATPVKENPSTKKPPPRRSSKSEDKLVQSIINSTMAKVPSPVNRMDTSCSGESSSSDSSSDTESEDSSSESHLGIDKPGSPVIPPLPTQSSPTPRWNLGSFLKTNVEGKGSGSPKDGKSTSYSSIDSSSEDPVPNPAVVSSTSVFNNSQSESPFQSPPAPTTNLAIPVKPTGRTRSSTNNEKRPEANIPPRQVPPIIPTKGTSSSTTKNASLSATSSDEEVEEKPKKMVAPKSTTVSEKKPPVNRKRPRQTSSSSRQGQKSDGESSPEMSASKSKMMAQAQDRNKSDTIRKLFRPHKNKKVESPSVVESDASKVNNGTSNSTTGGGKQTTAASNRISGKDSGRKANQTSVVQNGDVEPSGTYIIASDIGNKKKDGPKEKDSSHTQAKKLPKQSHAANSHGKSLTSPGVTAVGLAPPPGRLKEDNTGKASSSLSSLIVRIPLEKLGRRPRIVGAALPNAIISPSAAKIEKDLEKTVKGVIAAAGATNNTDSYRLKVPHNSSRVGSSSDPSNQPFAVHEPSIARDRDDPLCSDSERLPKHSSNKRPRKKSRSSPRKSKSKPETEPHIKVEEDLACEEVSSNVCDSVSVSTTRTPPLESDVVQAPDSSLNPPHLPSPAIPPQIAFYSYYEKFEHKDKLFDRDQDSYLSEAKQLKHSADGERSSTVQASLYLEAGLYFIMTGVLMERDTNQAQPLTSNAPYTMYRDTLTLIQYIGNRWRSRCPTLDTNYTVVEAKIIILSLRCQALLFLKLFKLKLKETKEMMTAMHEYFLKAPPAVVTRDPTNILCSPQLNTPSPCSPTSSPAGSSTSTTTATTTTTTNSTPTAVLPTPSPHHPHQNHLVTTIPKSLYSQINKNFGSTFHVVASHETWDQADALVEKYHVEDFFIGIDRQFGPLTLHSTLVDLVRYVKHGLGLINAS